MKIKFFIPLLILGAFIACDKGTTSGKEMYLGGLIINPTSNFVVLSKRDVVIDTFYLDKNNRFGGKINTTEEGLYVFKHPPENQVIYMEPGDSTLIFINTMEFDESLAFSGKGAEKSNYLNNMYLLNQKNNDIILSYYKLEPSEFASKTDSIRESRMAELTALNKRNKFSDEFLKIANASINYEFYDLRERYAYLIRRYFKEYIDKIPSDFHNYRKDISFDEEQLEDYYVYLNLIDDYLRTRSLEDCKLDISKNIGCYNLTDHENINRRITLADSLINNKRTKNIFIDRLAAQGIIYSDNQEEIKNILKHLEDIGYSGKRMEEFRQMAGIQNALLPGNNIGGLKLIKVNKDTVEIQKISRKPKITYHWSVNSQSHYKWQHQIISDLREKYPEIDFIGINIDKAQFKDWISILEKQNYSREFEYKLSSISVNEVLLKNYLNKMLFLDGSGTIVKGDAKMNSLALETTILEFLSEEK